MENPFQSLADVYGLLASRAKGLKIKSKSCQLVHSKAYLQIYCHLFLCIVHNSVFHVLSDSTGQPLRAQKLAIQQKCLAFSQTMIMPSSFYSWLLPFLFTWVKTPIMSSPHQTLHVTRTLATHSQSM